MDTVRSPAVTMDALLANSGWVRALALSLVRDGQGADDLVQEMWLRALESPPTRADTAGGWLATVLRNLARDGWRRDGRRTARESAAARPEALPPTSDLVARAEAHRTLIDHVTGLREPYRTVVLLRFFEDLPPREIARRLELPPATVRTQLHRALGMLRASLDGTPDGRDGWALALLPLPGSGFLKSASLTQGGGFVPALIGGLLVTTKQKLAVTAAALLLLCGGAAWVANTDADATDPTETAAAPAPDDTPEPAPSDADRRRVEPPAAPAKEPEPAADVEEPEPEPNPARPPPPKRRERLEYTVLRHIAPVPIPKGMTELKPGEEPEIPDPGTAVGPGRFGPRMLPYWRRWAPIPEKGTVTVHGRVTDASGRGLEGAQVYRVKLDENGQRASPSSYQWNKKMAVTDADGNYVAHEQPEGDFLVAADFQATMRRSRGLDVTPAVAASFTERSTLRGVDLQLPVESARLSTLHFVVTDETGKPKRNAEIRAPMERLYTDKKGRAELGGVRPGATKITVGATGYAWQTIEVDIEPGTEDEIALQLDFAEKGDLVLEGRVIDERGEPVANVPIFVGASRLGSRWAKTDETGVFRFEEMSRKYEKTEVSVMVSAHPERDPFKAAGKPVKTTVPSPGLVLHVQRTARLHVLIRDEETGEPLSLYNIETRVHATVDGEEQWRNYHSMSHYDEAGEAVFKVPTGRFRLTIRAKDHRGMEIEVDMPDALEDREILFEMKRE